MSILETTYVPQHRPYSTLELEDTKNNLFNKLHLSCEWANHEKCGHKYHVKTNGKKFNQIVEFNNRDVGNCSVCWKLSKTDNNLKNTAFGIVEKYNRDVFNDDSYSYNNADIENVYYKWLYVDT